ncbi:MAG: glycosyltransferase family 2 protein [Patescibacteria group bacterium]|nr:glycosyltransferase family 2 protein [Patescibacteria group bacterium]MBU2473003.1 glycosyltransferase family 2 protein [Patescibacteria group bacterium]
MNPLASIIILNLNGKKFLKDCFESLKRQTYQSFEIILVDNGSIDGSVEFIKKNFPETKIIVNKENLGFAYANNQGFKIANGKYFITLNNDTKADKKWLENLILIAESNKKIGMVASKIISLKDPNLIDSVGVNVCLNGMSRGRGRLEIDKGQYDKVEEIFLPSACAALYRKKMLEEIGFFDDNFFAYCEDTDLGIRGRLAGWKAFLSPQAVVYHYYSGTAGKYSPLKAFLVERNHFWLVIKNFPLGLILFYPFFTLWYYFLHFYGFLTKRGSSSKFVQSFSFWRLIYVIFKAYFSALIRLPRILGQRYSIKKQQKISNKDFYLLLKKFRLSFKEVTLKE